MGIYRTLRQLGGDFKLEITTGIAVIETVKAASVVVSKMARGVTQATVNTRGGRLK